MVYVMSDIHGHLERFNAIMEQINLQPEDHLYILGDVIDRNSDGIKILRMVMKAPNITMLKGNHEYMMEQTLSEPDTNETEYLWYKNGGRITHYKFKHYTKAMRKEILEYISSLPLNIDIEVNDQKYLLVHGSPISSFGSSRKYSLDTPEKYAVWNRLESSDPVPDGCTVIFGHTPTAYYTREMPMSIYYGENRIGIDCGGAYDAAKYGGRIGCLRLDDMKEFYSEYPDYKKPFTWY